MTKTKYAVVRTWTDGDQIHIAKMYDDMESAEKGIIQFRLADYSNDKYHIEIIEIPVRGFGENGSME